MDIISPHIIGGICISIIKQVVPSWIVLLKQNKTRKQPKKKKTKKKKEKRKRVSLVASIQWFFLGKTGEVFGFCTNNNAILGFSPRKMLRGDLIIIFHFLFYFLLKKRTQGYRKKKSLDPQK